MKIGLRPTKKDWRDNRFAFERNFGAVTSFDNEYNADIGSWVPDQGEDGRATGCTGYTVAEICSNEDQFRYSHDFNFMKTLQLMNVPPDYQGADLRKAAKVPCSFGLLPMDDQPADLFPCSQAWAANQANWPLSLDDEAIKFKKPAYLPIQAITQDWFDSIRNALVEGKAEKRTVGVGTRWSQDFENPILMHSYILTDTPSNLAWGHAYVFVGWKQIGSLPYLIAKTWQGKDYGDNGYVYMSRTLVNKLMKEWGTYAFTIRDVPLGTVDELKNQIVTLRDVIAMLTTFLQNAYGILQTDS